MPSYLLNTNSVPVISIVKTSIHLKEIRLEHNLTRYQLADTLQCSYQAIANWEDKEDKKLPALDKLVTMSVIYNCHIEDLLVIDNYKTQFLEVHEESNPYGAKSNLISHPTEFKNFTNRKVILESGEIANGFYITSSYSLHFNNGYLSDKYNKSGKFVSPAVYSTDNKHFEHWKNGVLHCEDGPAVIDGLENYEEWWINGNQVEPQKYALYSECNFKEKKMKKITKLLLTGLFAAIFVSCSNPSVTSVPEQDDGETVEQFLEKLVAFGTGETSDGTLKITYTKVNNQIYEGFYKKVNGNWDSGSTDPNYIGSIINHNIRKISNNKYKQTGDGKTFCNYEFVNGNLKILFTDTATAIQILGNDTLVFIKQ